MERLHLVAEEAEARRAEAELQYFDWTDVELEEEEMALMSGLDHQPTNEVWCFGATLYGVSVHTLDNSWTGTVLRGGMARSN